MEISKMAGASLVMAPAEAGHRQTKPQQQRLIKEAATAVEMAMAAGVQSILSNIWELGNHLHPG